MRPRPVAGAPPIFASSSFFVPAYAGPWQNSISEIEPQCSWHDADRERHEDEQVDDVDDDHDDEVRREADEAQAR